MLLINAVNWSADYPARHPLRRVPAWYRSRFEGNPEVCLRVVHAESDLRRALRNGAAAVIISGSPRDAWTDDPINQRLCDVIFECRERKLPFLGICYGHQLLARALGGKVAPHPAGLELGNVAVRLTKAGRRFPLFAGLPPRFEVLLSHVDAVLELPSDCELLVTGRHTRIQAFHTDLLMGVQFHPELDPESLRFIWSVRRDCWRKRVDFDLDRRLDTLRPTPLVNRVLNNFVNHFIP
ncbi:MAG: type 1 glutamine amidotransferase [Limisphaerales bacterium]